MDVGAVGSRPWIYGWSGVDRGHGGRGYGWSTVDRGHMGGRW